MNLDVFEKVFSTDEKINQETIRTHISKIKELSAYLPKTQSYFMIQDTVNQTVDHVCDNYKLILGYEKSELLNNGLPFHFSHYHPEDIAIWQDILNGFYNDTCTSRRTA